MSKRHILSPAPMLDDDERPDACRRRRAEARRIESRPLILEQSNSDWQAMKKDIKKK
jgi:hypothetical protein